MKSCVDTLIRDSFELDLYGIKNIFEYNNHLRNMLKCNFIRSCVYELRKIDKIKTQFGMFNVKINVEGGSDREIKIRRMLAEFIFNKMVEFGDKYKSFKELVENEDIGLVVYNDKIYFNIEKDVAKWIFDNGPNEVLLEVCSGIKGYHDMNDPYKIWDRYLSLYKTYDKKAKVLGVEKDLLTSLVEEMDLVEIGNYGKYNGSDFVTMTCNEIADSLWRDYYEIFELLWYGGYTLNEILESEGYIEDSVLVSNLLEKIKDHVIDLIGDKYIETRIDFDIMHSEGIEFICNLININTNRLCYYLLSNVDIIKAIDMCVEYREKYNVGYCGIITRYEDNEETTLKPLLTRLIRERIENEKKSIENEKGIENEKRHS